MAEHFSDEEQLENLKKWWQEYGIISIAIISISVGGYFGLIFYKENQREQSEVASSKYQDMLNISLVAPGKKISATQQKLIEKLATELKISFEGSQYSIYSALMMAKLHVEKNDLDEAAKELEWALSHTEKELAPIIKLRLARVEASRGNIDLALSMIKNDIPKNMTSAYSEAQGDFYMLKEDKVSAYDYYTLAVNQLKDHDNPHVKILRLKLNKVTPKSPLKEDRDTTGDQN